MRHVANRLEDFWAHVDRTATCWIWTGARFEKGYGAFRYAGRSWRAHRLSWTLAKGPIPTGMQVNHHCDNPTCVNPDHLYVGDQLQNRRDAVLRNRTATGERHGRAKLTTPQVAEIRQRYADGQRYRRGAPGYVTLKALALEFGVDHTVIAGIVHNRLWRVA